MPRGRWLLLLAVGIAVQLGAAQWVTSPGYMDADYYYATGRQLAEGRGFQEPFLWNYLDDPPGLPHPSHLYWMPLPSIMAATGMTLFGEGFAAAQLPFLLVAAVLPVLTASLSLRLSKNPSLAFRAGLLAAFSGFFLPFLSTTDAFGIYAVIGSLTLWRLGVAGSTGRRLDWLIAGLLIGISNLVRADAPLLLLAGALLALPLQSRRVQSLLLLAVGFGLAMAPWWLRNLREVGALLNPGSERVLWMLDYDDLFSYPGELLSFERWRAAGLGAAVGARLSAGAVNLQRLLAENGMIFLAPFMLIGMIRKSSEAAIRATAYYLGLLFLTMTIVFPFVGSRGALFHSGAAAMPILWAVAPLGVDRAVERIGAKRDWNIPTAQKFFGAGAVVMAALITGGLFLSRLVLNGANWNSSEQAYRSSVASLPDLSEAVVAVNNPPGFHLQCDCLAVSIPDGDSTTLKQVVERYGVDWVVLEANHPRALESLYLEPDSLDWLTLRNSLDSPEGGTIYVLQVGSS